VTTQSARGRILDCVRCPKRLRYVTTRREIGTGRPTGAKTVVDVHVYECASHGRFSVGPNGRLVPTT
jgi:hypothetical protein